MALRKQRPPALKGFLPQGTTKEQEVVSLLLMEIERKVALYIFLSGPKRLDEKSLQRIVTGIQLIPGRYGNPSISVLSQTIS